MKAKELLIGGDKEKDMGSSSKGTQIEQRAHWEHRLNQRVASLADKGYDPERIKKDTAVRQIRAKIREAESRLRRIKAKERKLEEMARIKAEKQAEPVKEKGRKKEVPEEKTTTGKRQEKKKKKQESKA